MNCTLKKGMRVFGTTLVLGVAVLLISACGGSSGGGSSGSGGGGGVPLSSLSGTWFGTIEDPVGDLHTISLSVNSTGEITSERIDGSSTGLTGVIEKVSGTIFGFVLSDGTEGGFIVSAGGTHAGFLDEDFNFGVVQKGASSLPIFVEGDVVGTWSGFGVLINSNFEVTGQSSSSATVNSNFLYSGNDISGSFNGIIDFYSEEFGVFWDTLPGDVIVGIFLSPDKLFAATYGCEGFFNFSNCSFNLWNRN